MALSSLRWFSKGRNSFNGSTAGSFDKFEQGASPKYHIGFPVEEVDGSKYRYVHFGATVNRGVLVSNDLSETSDPDQDNTVIAPASAVTTSDGTVGSYYLQATYASVVANQFAFGKLITTDDTGEGYTYDIVGNTATNDPATGDIRIQLAQKIQVALDATTDVSIQSNPYHDVEIATTTDEFVVGVSCATISAADNYGWIQTRGIVGCLQDGTVTLGGTVQLSDGTSGAFQDFGGGGTDALDLTTEPILGFCVDPGDTGGHGVIYLQLD